MRTATIVVLTMCLTGCRSTSRYPLPEVMGPDAGDTLWVFPESPDELGTGGELQIFIDAHSHPHARASFARFTLAVGGALPVHRHDRTEEYAYIISGAGVAVALNADGREAEMPLAAGYVWYNPPGAWHAVRNTGTTPLAMIFATVPNDEKGLLSFFRKVCTEPGKQGVRLSTEELHRVGARHDVIFRDATDGE